MIITLCGSTRFESWFHEWNRLLSLSGHTVFSLSMYPSYQTKESISIEDKSIFDLVHLNKISHSDIVLFLNVFAYLGESSLKEYTFSEIQCKTIYALESWGIGFGVGPDHTKEYQVLASVWTPEHFKSPIDMTHKGNPFDLLSNKNRSKLVIEYNNFKTKMGYPE